MENFDKLPFTEPPSYDATLMELCCRKISTCFDCYDHDRLSGLPSVILTELLWYLTPHNLHNITSLLQQKGTDAGPVWRRHILQHKPWLIHREASYIDEDDNHHFFQLSKAWPYHQKYLTMHSGYLLKKVIAGENLAAHPQMYKSLLHLLPSVHSIRIKLRYFNRLIEWEEILNILINNLQTLILTEIEDMMLLMDGGVERTVQLLQKFCDRKSLRGIVFHSTLDYLGGSWGFGRKLSTILDVLGTVSDSSFESTEGKCVTDQHESLVEETNNRLYDDALTFGENKTWLNDVLIQIDQNLATFKEDHSMDRDGTSSLTSLSFCYVLFLDVLEQHMPKWKFLQRLNLETNDYNQQVTKGLLYEILVRVGSHKFTHLRFADIKAGNIVPQMLYILCEYYKADGANFQPMELLNLTSTGEGQPVILDDLSEDQFSKLESEVHAVRDLCISRQRLDSLGFTALNTFLQLNMCLTSLRLIFISPRIAQPDLLWIPILESLSKKKFLRSVCLSKCKLAKDTETLILTTTLCSLLNRLQTLQILKLVDCCMPKELVESKEFIEAVQNHSNLNILSLSMNKLGASGANFLSSLFERGCQKLQELDISSCSIHGRDLLAAAQALKLKGTTRPLLNKLDISDMLLDQRTPGGQLHEQLREEFRNLALHLEVKYLGNHMADHIANM